MKALVWVGVGIIATVAAVTALGWALTDGPLSKNEPKDKPSKADEPASTTDAADTASPTPEAAQADNVVPFGDAEAADTGVAADDTSASHKENLVNMKIAHPNDPAVGSVEKSYLTLVKAIHSGKVKGTEWRAGEERPDADVIELRGRTIDLFTALKTPRLYFETDRPGLSLAYQYTTRKQPLIFIQVDDYLYVLGGDSSRFLSSVPHPEELRCDPNAYLHLTLECLLEKLGLDEKSAQA